ncbi:MAG TPA: DUF4351 domain-containing protein [Chthonomonadaceae bacterium]|nr:DUF4351 domain-containing protein [Chthonomonadaceae bacterium]
MQLISSFKREGIKIGQKRIVMRQIKKRFGVVPSEIEARLDALTADELDELGESLFDFRSITDVENWLARHQPNGHAAPPSLSA